MSGKRNFKVRQTVLALICLSALAVLMPAHAQTGQSVSLGWQASTDPSVTGYNVYYGTASQNYTNEVSTGNATSVTISGLVPGTTYYFAGTSYNSQNQESAFTTEVSYTVPLPVTNEPPVITGMQSTNAAVIGQNVTFSVSASGTSPLSYQWNCNSNAITSATNATLTLPNISQAQAGAYSVTVSDNTGATNSPAILLKVYPAATPTLTPTAFAKGHFGLNICGSSNCEYVVEASTDLVNWIPVATNVSPFTFVDPNMGHYQKRFFRACYSTAPLPASPVSDITNGLMAWYPLAGDLTDHSGNGNNGTGVGTLAYSGGPLNVANTALGFDGTDTYIYANNVSSSIANTTPITIAGWIHPNDMNGVYGCFGFRAGSDGPGAFYIDTLTTGIYEARFRNGAGNAVTLNAPLTTGSWVFVALTYDGSTLTLYTNGVAAASAPASGNFGVSNLPFYIGGTGYTLTELPDFPMAGIRLYNRAISPVEMEQLYSNGTVNGIF